MSVAISKKNGDKTTKIIISVGDESGVGPEVVLKAIGCRD